ncbi:hypothetical protein [Azospirillum aestuarii]|uniref:hypothetical protein n=1 Tax=Azospirillum aestuarii TaxID=2802052 RepID=UPI004054E545
MKSKMGLWASLVLTCSSVLPFVSEALAAQNLIVGTTNVGQSTVCGVPVRVNAVEHKDLELMKTSYFVRVVPLAEKSGEIMDLSDADVNIINTAVANAPNFNSSDYKTESGYMAVERSGLKVIAESRKGGETIVRLFFKGISTNNCDVGSLQELRRLLLDGLSQVISMRK